jgi:hypothetical protein
MFRKKMVNQDHKDEIIRFVLDSSDEENEKLAVFMAGIQAQEQAFERKEPGEDVVPVGKTGQGA